MLNESDRFHRDDLIDRLKQAQAPPLKRELSRPQPVSVAAKVAR